MLCKNLLMVFFGVFMCGFLCFLWVVVEFVGILVICRVNWCGVVNVLVFLYGNLVLISVLVMSDFRFFVVLCCIWVGIFLLNSLSRRLGMGLKSFWFG